MTSTVDIRVVDPHDESQLRAWWEVHHGVELERPLDLADPWEVDRIVLAHPKIGMRRTLLAAFLGADLVGAALLLDPIDHNPHLATGELAVATPHRRRGVATALLAAAEGRARGDGRTTMLLDVRAPLEGGPTPGRIFAEAHGYRVANDEVAKVVDLRATEHRWPALAAQADERVGEHRLTWFRGACPDDVAEGVCAMFSRFLGEIPLGDVDLRPQQWTVDRLRAVEATRRRDGGDYLMVLATDADGTPVGYSDVGARLAAPRLGYIHSTLVLPQARGHRLGLAMKVRLHQLTRRELPDTELILTGNAGVNVPMNAVNEALGYEPVDRLLEMQKLL